MTDKAQDSKIKTEKEESWTTGDEKKFLKNMPGLMKLFNMRGTHLDTLRRYLQVAELRKNWDKMDREEVLAYAHELLGELEKA